jgi:hypothetical protein
MLRHKRDGSASAQKAARYEYELRTAWERELQPDALALTISTTEGWSCDFGCRGAASPEIVSSSEALQRCPPQNDDFGLQNPVRITSGSQCTEICNDNTFDRITGALPRKSRTSFAWRASCCMIFAPSCECCSRVMSSPENDSSCEALQRCPPRI